MDLSLYFNFCKFFIKIYFLNKNLAFGPVCVTAAALANAIWKPSKKAQGGIGFLTHFGGRQSFYTFTIVDNLNMLD